MTVQKAIECFFYFCKIRGKKKSSRGFGDYRLTPYEGPLTVMPLREKIINGILLITKKYTFFKIYCPPTAIHETLTHIVDVIPY